MSSYFLRSFDEHRLVKLCGFQSLSLRTKIVSPSIPADDISELRSTPSEMTPFLILYQVKHLMVTRNTIGYTYPGKDKCFPHILTKIENISCDKRISYISLR